MGFQWSSKVLITDGGLIEDTGYPDSIEVDPKWGRAISLIFKIKP